MLALILILTYGICNIHTHTLFMTFIPNSCFLQDCVRDTGSCINQSLLVFVLIVWESRGKIQLRLLSALN